MLVQMENTDNYFPLCKCYLLNYNDVRVYYAYNKDLKYSQNNSSKNLFLLSPFDLKCLQETVGGVAKICMLLHTNPDDPAVITGREGWGVKFP